MLLARLKAASTNSDARDAACAKADAKHGSRQGKLKEAVSMAAGSLSYLRGAERLEDDMDSVFASNVLRLGERYKGRELDVVGDRAGKDEDADAAADADMMRMFTHVDDRLSSQALASRQLARAVRDRDQHEKAVSNCESCVGSVAFDGALMVAAGQHVVLRLKAGPLRLTDGHCTLSPTQHIPSSLQLEEDAAEELARFKQSLTRMFEEQGLVVLFLETAVGRKHAHAVIDVVPVPRDVAGDAAGFFKQAMLDADDEFKSQHKKLIELTAERPLRRAIPRHFSYVMYSDGVTGAGLAHIVEDEAGVTSDFCLDVIAGMLDEVPMRMRGGRKKVGVASVEDVNLAKQFFNQHQHHFKSYM